MLNKHAPLNKKVARANHAPYITKNLRKAIMKRSYLEKVYFKKKTPDSLKKLKRKRITAAGFTKKSGKIFRKS